ncbi:uncharacterized protein BO95DRAFT_515425 [Aspergillus brunneoviolaceus CBS 621.78]|uniref:Uncharacterized protein n=1 Tax=Aspergillus brunneoviolaceus CBS 621.78 TaxID=1450534 RepID=A0ACD1G5S1_9EURO|nr:hypothetical protein BO95DRAFT_515425 [Aspergillus brunneoviolaceus CBS 621.78]RAH44610.1 hypothetical protein BO95DRAFT_515425 [Aspergillus brunneoviolaceus CBS 621.78]
MPPPPFVDGKSPGTISITVPSDLKLFATQNYRSLEDGLVYKHTTFQVDRGTLLNSSQYFLSKLEQPLNGRKTIVEIGCHSITALEIILRKLHNTLDQKAVGDASLADVWCLIFDCRQFRICPKNLTQWFDAGCTHKKGQANPGMELSFYRDILLPSYAMEHATTFARAARALMYQSTEHITSWCPPDVRMPIAAPILRQLNAARATPHDTIRGSFWPRFQHASNITAILLQVYRV